MGSNAGGNPRLRQVVQAAKRGGGFVYAVAFNADGPVKIGKSVRPRVRLAEIETTAGARLAHIHVTEECTNFDEMEAGLHEALAQHRAVGEWFNLPFRDAVEAVNSRRLNPSSCPEVSEDELREAAERVKPPTPEMEARAIETETRLGYR